jgi:hypothetical protein
MMPFGPPMSLGNMRANGVRSLDVSCWQCHHGARHHWCRRPAELAGTAAAREPDRGAMAVSPQRGVAAEQHRALRLLAGAPLGATEAMMLAHGLTDAMLDALVRDGLATAERRAMKAGRRRIEVTWLTITEEGRQALAG